MGTHLLFEGLDFAGKTTAARNLIAANSDTTVWELRKRSILGNSPDRVARAEFKRDTRFIDGTNGWLNYAALLDDLSTYQPPTVPVVQESVTAFKSHAYHRVLGDRDLADKLTEQLPRLDIFDNVFLMTASISTRQDRLRRRMEHSPGQVSFFDMLVQEQPKQFIEMEKVMFDAVHTASNALVHVIDTSERRPIAVTKIVASIIGYPEVA